MSTENEYTPTTAQAHTPTDDEHEARYDGRLRCADCGGLMGLEGRGGDSERWVHLSVGLRLPVQGEPTDAEIAAAIRGYNQAYRENVSATASHLFRAALRAAAAKGGKTHA